MTQAKKTKTSRVRSGRARKKAKAAGTTAPDARLPRGPQDNACVVCGTEASEIHCRLVCPKCGAMRDCSDP
ncbi:MAG: hypothetical protein HY075_16320 [Deltaproteobacteria bacterium]|nr:hypothetical protein [Deltaproteobacteria bacterium]